MKKRLPVLPLLLIIGLVSCQSQQENLTILVTTDVHGAFFSQDPVTGEIQDGSMARFSNYLKSTDGQKNRLILDNGDIIQGDPSAYYYNFEETDSEHLFTTVMHELEYDAATVGNHDIETGHPVYDRIKEELNIPWLAANCIRTATGEPYFDPYTIIKKGPLKIAVFGLITPRIPDWLPENIWAGMEFTDMVQSAAYWVPIIQEKEQPDLLIGLFHAGLDYTYNNQSAHTPHNENAVRLVIEQVSGFDVVFCGHDHQTWNEYQLDPEGDSVLILGSQSRVREIARADLEFVRQDHSWRISRITGMNVPMDPVNPDENFMQRFEHHFTAVKDYVNQEVAELTTELDSKDAFFGPSAFMTLIHQVQLDISGADLSFAAPLAFNKVIPSGILNVKDLFDLYRFENLLYTMELTGKEILDYLNYSYRLWFTSGLEKTGHLLRMYEDDNGFFRTATPYYNFDSALGIDYQVDLRQPAGQMVQIIRFSDGSPFNPDKTYRVAINSYRGNGGGGHLTEGAGIPAEELSGRTVASTDKDLRYHMKEWMESEKTIGIHPVTNWKVLPESTYQTLKEIDYQALFRN